MMKVSGFRFRGAGCREQLRKGYKEFGGGNAEREERSRVPGSGLKSDGRQGNLFKFQSTTIRLQPSNISRFLNFFP